MRHFALALALLVASAFSVWADESSGTVYRWETSDGVVSYTNDLKAIPPTYRAVAQERTWEEVREATQGHFSSAPEVSPAPPPILVIPAERPPAPTAECEGAVTVTRIREQRGDYNVPIYLTTDACGRVLSRTRDNPDIQVNQIVQP